MDPTRAVYAFTNTIIFTGIIASSAWIMNKLFGRNGAPKFQAYWNLDANRGGHTGIMGMHRYMFVWFCGCMVLLYVMMYRIQTSPESLFDSFKNIF